MTPTDRDLELATAHLLATGKTHTKADLDTLAELLAQVRTEERAAVVAAAKEHLGDEGVESTDVSIGSSSS